VKVLGKRLKSARESKKLTQEQMSHLLDISQATYSKVENGDVRITLERLQQVCRILNVSIEQLLSESGSGSIPNTVIPHEPTIPENLPVKASPDFYLFSDPQHMAEYIQLLKDKIRLLEDRVRFLENELNQTLTNRL
jgi:transcriptional regulator with XRE-family HTH domain